MNRWPHAPPSFSRADRGSGPRSERSANSIRGSSGWRVSAGRPTGLSPATIGIGAELPIGGADERTGLVITVHALGTAIRRDHATGRSPTGQWWISEALYERAGVSGQAFWTLLRTGHRPIGMVMGSCVYHVAHRGPIQTVSKVASNVELPNYTQALYSARELAMQRMQTEAQALQARGIVGVDTQEKSHG